MIKFTMTKVRLVLKDIVFNPKKDRHMLIITKVGDHNYYKQRAIELLMSGPTKTDIILAIRLLIIYLITGYKKYNEPTIPTKTKKS